MTISRESLHEYLQDNFGLEQGSFEDSTELFSTGLLDSFSVADLLMYIEDNGNFMVEPDEVTYDNIDSIEKILAFAQKKNAALAG